MKIIITSQTILVWLLFMALIQISTAQNFIESPQTQPFTGTIYSSTAFADVDGDNDQDVLITGRTSSHNRIAVLYTNDGSGNFTELSGTPFDGVQDSSIAFADVDDDNDQDVLITGLSDSGFIAKLYTNDGSGNFSEVSGTPFDGVEQSSIAFADVDGDKDPDVLITGMNTAFVQIAKLYLNDGSGNYTEETGTPFEGVDESAIAFADIDGDSDLDVLITGFNFNGVNTKLYTNDGSGQFTEMMNTPFYGVGASSVAFADIDGDNDQDVVISGATNTDRITTLYTNDGTGIFSEVLGTPFEGVAFSSLAFSDVDGDNDQDMLLSGSSADALYTVLYTNDGTGNFTEYANTPFEDINNGAINFVDVDGDNDEDVLITGQNNSFVNHISTLYLNQLNTLSTQSIDINDNLSVYPNPVRDVLNIKTNYNLEHIEVFNMNGQLVWSQPQDSSSLSIENLNAGMYLLRIKTDVGFTTKKIVKQ